MTEQTTEHSKNILRNQELIKLIELNKSKDVFVLMYLINTYFAYRTNAFVHPAFDCYDKEDNKTHSIQLVKSISPLFHGMDGGFCLECGKVFNKKELNEIFS